MHLKNFKMEKSVGVGGQNAGIVFFKAREFSNMNALMLWLTKLPKSLWLVTVKIGKPKKCKGIFMESLYKQVISPKVDFYFL